MLADMTFRGIDVSEAMENYAAKYLTKFKKYFGKLDPESIFVHVIFDGDMNHHQFSCQVRIKTAQFDLVVKKEGPEMYPIIDDAMHVMEQELQKSKQRVVDDTRKKKKCC